MSETNRDDRGRFTETVTEQEILKAFDRADAPFLTAAELGEQVGVSRQAANHRLKGMHEEGRVERKRAGARAVAWWATVAPAPSTETLRDIEATEGELERGETVSQADVKRRLGMDG